MINTHKANQYCKEDITLIENYYEAVNDETQTWDCHHRREIDENKSHQQLKDEGLYYKRPACELIFLTSSDHISLHSSGSRNPMYGKNYMNYMTDEAKENKSIKQSVAMTNYWATHEHPSLGGTSWIKGLTKETDAKVKQMGENISKTRKEKCSTGEIVVWNKGKKGVQTAWNKGKKGAQVAHNKGTKLMTDGNKRLYVNVDEIDKYIEKGFHLGSK